VNVIESKIDGGFLSVLGFDFFATNVSMLIVLSNCSNYVLNWFDLL